MLASTSSDEDSSNSIQNKNSGLKSQEQFLSRIKSFKSIKMVPIDPKRNTQKVTFQQDLAHSEYLKQAPSKDEKANILDLIDRNPYPKVLINKNNPTPQKQKEEEECDWFAESSSEEELQTLKPSPPTLKELLETVSPSSFEKTLETLVKESQEVGGLDTVISLIVVIGRLSNERISLIARLCYEMTLKDYVWAKGNTLSEKRNFSKNLIRNKFKDEVKHFYLASFKLLKANIKKINNSPQLDAF